MKRIALIVAASFVLSAAAAAGSIVYFKPAVVFGAAKAEVVQAHGVPSYTEGASEEAEARAHALRLVEQLGAVQDRIIRGDRSALADQTRLLTEIAGEVRNFGQEEWDDYVNVRTSLLYVLSGGDARVLNIVVARNSLSDSDQRLAAGIIGFAEGKLKKAREFFEGIDPRSLDVSLVGPFALARASLYLEDDRARAIDLLDDARLACPHTAIEEAAARREIPILIDAGNTPRAMMLTASYVREFGKSIYAWKLFRDFSTAIANRGELDSTAIVDELVAALDEKDMQPASVLFVDIAGEALLLGRLKLAKAAADRVLTIESASPEVREKARLYAAAAAAPSDDAGNAMKVLDQITDDRLSEEDTEIREVAGFIAKTVALEPNDPAYRPGGAPAPMSATAAQGAGATNAMAALNSADAILKKADFMISGSEK